MTLWSELMCMSKLLKGQTEYPAQQLQPAKCITKKQNLIIKPTPEKVWNYCRQSDKVSKQSSLF